MRSQLAGGQLGALKAMLELLHEKSTRALKQNDPFLAHVVASRQQYRSQTVPKQRQDVVIVSHRRAEELGWNGTPEAWEAILRAGGPAS